jgi:hypothetical protein
MAKAWTVVQHTGNRMDLEQGFEKLEVRCPKEPIAKKIFMDIQPGRSVDEGTLRLLTGNK